MSFDYGSFKMPTISAFYGLIIQMYFREHAPPHFHVRYADHKAVVDIQGLSIIEGKLPRRASHLVLDWAELHQAELMRDWDLCQALQQPEPIAPLE
jgi:hypothetical protein